MKKLNIWGLITSLFVVFALASCSKDEPTNEDSRAFIGKTYQALEAWEGELPTGPDGKVIENIQLYKSFSFETDKQVRLETGVYIPSSENKKEYRKPSMTIVFNYVYYKENKRTKLTKVLSATNHKGESEVKFGQRVAKHSSIKFNNNFQMLTIITNLNNRTITATFKLRN